MPSFTCWRIFGVHAWASFSKIWKEISKLRGALSKSMHIEHVLLTAQSNMKTLPTLYRNEVKPYINHHEAMGSVSSILRIEHVASSSIAISTLKCVILKSIFPRLGIEAKYSRLHGKAMSAILHLWLIWRRLGILNTAIMLARKSKPVADISARRKAFLARGVMTPFITWETE